MKSLLPFPEAEWLQERILEARFTKKSKVSLGF